MMRSRPKRKKHKPEYVIKIFQAPYDPMNESNWDALAFVGWATSDDYDPNNNKGDISRHTRLELAITLDKLYALRIRDMQDFESANSIIGIRYVEAIEELEEYLKDYGFIFSAAPSPAIRTETTLAILREQLRSLYNITGK